ncbi:MAG: M56 family metallopeptidase [Saprospiraceae bacterium]|nr:M56 family metallopeptidase [Saprospiraceae bacterium]
MPDSLLRALGWALAHSLWQGALAALALLILLPRLQTARQRYWAAYGTLIAVFAAAIVTFVWKFEPGVNGFPAAAFSAETPGATSYITGNQLFETTLSESFSQWLEANHVLIVAAWLIGFVFFLLRLGGGLWQVHRLRTRGLIALEAHWQERILALSGRIGVSKAVQLFESAWVHAPLTIGWLKPAILLPIGFVNQLPTAEVEAVLAHELAHIARRDWVFNLLQAFVESLFYYHPTVWWVSQVIRRERENACDDAALAATGNPLAFARALVQVQEMATPLPALALALSGKRRRPLLDRVRRILNQAPQQQHQVMEKITATVILLALLALVGLRANSVPSIEAAFAQIADFPASVFADENAEDQMVGDSLPKPKNTRKITREDDNGRIEAEYKNGKLQRLNIDGKEIPESEFAQHEALIENLEEDVPPPPAPPVFWGGPEGHSWPAPAPPGAPEAPAAPGMFWFHAPGSASIAPFPPMPPMPPMGSGISIVTDKDGEGNTISGFNFGEGDFSSDSRISPQEREKIKAEIKRAKAEHERTMNDHKRDLDREMKNAQKEWKESQKVWQKEQKKWQKEQLKWEQEQKVWQDEHRAWEAKNKAAQEHLKRELLRDGLISDPYNFSLKINAKSLKINKEKQSEELRRKYEELIKNTMGLKLEGDDWNYNFNFKDDQE